MAVVNGTPLQRTLVPHFLYLLGKSKLTKKEQRLQRLIPEQKTDVFQKKTELVFIPPTLLIKLRNFVSQRYLRYLELGHPKKLLSRALTHFP